MPEKDPVGKYLQLQQDVQWYIPTKHIKHLALVPSKSPKKETEKEYERRTRRNALARLRREPKNKFCYGPVFRSMNELSSWLRAGNWVYWRRVPKHPSIIYGMPYRIVERVILNGTVRRAIRREDMAS